MEKTKEIIDYLKFLTKLRVLRYAKDCGKNKNACEVFGVKKSTFYKWKKEFEQHGEKGLVRKKTIAKFVQQYPTISEIVDVSHRLYDETLWQMDMFFIKKERPEFLYNKYI
jgi:transposase